MVVNRDQLQFRCKGRLSDSNRFREIAGSFVSYSPSSLTSLFQNRLAGQIPAPDGSCANGVGSPLSYFIFLHRHIRESAGGMARADRHVHETPFRLLSQNQSGVPLQKQGASG